MKKMTVGFTDKEIEDIKALAKKRDMTMTQILRQAISTESFIDDRLEHGYSFVLRKGGEPDQCLIFRWKI